MGSRLLQGAALLPEHRLLIESVDALSDRLIEVSHAIHANPELAFEERLACRTLTQAIEREGLRAQSGVFTLPTSFETSFGNPDGPTVALLAEYDALPGIGHACGHNIIAAAALGAALALARRGDALPGTVRLIGTPAEERGGGKELMARAGCFDGVDAALMIHPAGMNLATMPSICVAEVSVVYHGRAAHASAMPHNGINALDGLLLAYQAISNLRQHIRSTERIHGIVTDGGSAPNVVPDRAAGTFFVRAADEHDLAALKPRVEGCFEAGAIGSGARVEIGWGKVDYLDLNTNWPLAERFQTHAESLGREFVARERLSQLPAGSTDMGNVSHRVPAIHPLVSCAPQDVLVHHPDFARWAGSQRGDAAVLDAAKALALTAFDFMQSQALQGEARRAFEVSKGLA